MELWKLVAVAVFAGLVGCTGVTTGENNPGEGTAVDADRPPAGVDQGESCRFNGSLAVDDRTDTVYVLQTDVDAPCSRYATNARRAAKTLYAVEPDAGGTTIADMSLRQNTQVLFPEDQVLVLSESVLDEDGEPLATVDGVPARTFIETYDPASLERTGREYFQERLSAPRLSPSRRYLAVDRDVETLAILRTDLLGDADPFVEVPASDELLRASWLNQSDRLIAISFDHPGSPRDASARVVSWNVDTAESPEIDVTLPGLTIDLLGSFTRVEVSPDDRYAVIPVRRYTGDTIADFQHQLLIIDFADGSLRYVDDARGPVGFTPDSSTIVSYRYFDPSEPELLLIDHATLDETVLDIPDIVSPQFFVTREGNAVILASAFGNRDVVLYDLDQLEQTRLSGLRVDLHEFVSLVGRGELWLVDDGLFRLDFINNGYERIELDWTPWHIARLSSQPTLVLDDVMGGRVVFFDAPSQTVVREVELGE